MPDIVINGQHLVLLGIDGDVGDRNSVASIVVPVEVPDLVTAFALASNAKAVAEAVGISGLICTGRPFSQAEDGAYVVRFQFEGFNSEVSFEQGEENCVYAWEPEESDEPIETHPNFLKPGGLAEKGAWDFNEEKFAKHADTAGKGSTALSKADLKNPPTNILFGIEAWTTAGGTFSRSYAVSRVPADLYRGIGTLIDYPPGAENIGIPRFKRRKWLKKSPSVTTGQTGSGSAIRITERYRLTGATTGAEEIIYVAGQLED